MREILVFDRDIRPQEPGPAPMLQWLPIDSLRVDESYQRELKRENWTAIRKIAASFKWSRFSPVFVAPISGGHYAIIDGQHRSHAAALCGFETVPCQIVQMSHSGQAEAFAAVNGMVTKITVWNLYRASLAAGTEWAVELKSTAEKAGCLVAEANNTAKAKKAGEIYAIEGIRKLIARSSADTVASALSLLRHAKGWESEASFWAGDVLLPVVDALCAFPDQLVATAFADRFEEFPLWAKIDAIAETVKRAVRSGMEHRPKREQLTAELRAWLAIPSSTGLAVRPGTDQSPGAARTFGAPMITETQRRQAAEAADRRRRLGL